MGLTKKLLLFVLGWALSSSLWAVTCTDIFSNGLQAHASNGTINLGYQTRINGGTATLQTKNLSDNSQHLACNGATCVPSGVPSSTSTVTFQTGSAANGAINVGYQGSLNVGSGDYGFANVEQEGSLRFNTNNGTYLIRGLSTKYRSEIRLRTGDYWIDGDVTLSQETVLRRITASGSTRIFVRGNVTIGYQVTTDSFTADQLLIYATGNIYISQASNLHGFLYAGGNLDIGYGVTINGAAAGASVYANAGQSITNYQSSLLAAGDFAPFCSGVSTTPVLLGSWRMDEGFWNGTANEVIDSSGNGNHGRASIAAGSTPLPTTESGSPAFTSGNQNTCYYGSFDRTTSPVRTYSYVELTGFPTLPNGFTFAAWIRSTNAGAQHQRILVRDDAQNGWGLSLADGTGQPKLRFFARNITNNGAVSGQGTNPSCGVFCIDTTAVLTSNAWFYVAAAVDTTAKTVTLYVYNQAGVLQARASGAYSGTWTDGSGTAAIGGETSASAEGRQTSWHFLGNIDEVNIYSGALAQTSIESLMRTVRTCAGPDHYELQVASENVACEGAVVTVRACANSLVPCTVDMSINTNVGLATTAGSLAVSTVTLSNGEATTRLLYPAAADGATAILNMENEQTIAVNARKCCTGSSSCTVANSCSTQFKTAGFIFSNTATATGNIANQIAGTTDNNVYLRAVKTNTATGACVARFSSPQNVQLAYQCINPTTCIAGQHLYLGGTSVQANAAATPVASLVYTSKELTFDSNGSAAIPLNYTDAGQLRLRARLALGATASEPAYTLTGTSNDLVVKPHSLVVASVVGGSNQPNPGSSGSGSGFIAAGESFKVNLEARNASGAITPNFGREQVPEFTNLGVSASSLVYPTGGTLTALNNGGSFAATATQGRFENSNYSWNQVGSITLVPALGDNDYLGAGDIPNLPASSTVGRFYPYQYRLSSATSSNSCGSFSYMGQPEINLTYALQAESVTGAILTNYDNTDQATPYAGAASLSYVAEDANNGTNLGSRVLMPAQTWNNGQVMFNSNTLEFARQASGAPDGPFSSLQLGLQLSDSLDNRPLAALDMNPGTNLVCSGASCTAKTLGNPLQLRYGRLRLEDAFGPESVDLPVNFYTQYWSGNFFVKNTSDSCTRILRSAITYPAGNLLTPANLTVALSGGSTQGVYNSLTASEVVFTSGDAGHSFLAPGTGTGSFPVDVDLTTYPWLRYDWNQNGDYSDTALPRANFGFGQYRGHDRIIYWRERLE